MVSTRRTLIVIGGPTASGKTRVAAEVAKALGTEVVSADARQFYRAMPIGTGQPTEAEMLGVPHHFIGHLEVEQAVSAQEYANAALPVIERLLDAHGVAVLTGGSGLYVDAVCFEFDALPPADKALRERLQRMDIAALQDELKRLDEAMWHRIDRQNPHRLIRAIEVCLLTGGKVSELHRGKRPRPGFEPLFFALDVDRRKLYRNIDARVDEMVVRGVVEEARALFPHRQLNALQTVGYKELFLHFDRPSPPLPKGEGVSLDEAIALMKQHTRNYAKRQMTWLRREELWHWVRPEEAVQVALDLAKA
jgi:tRNA dimethylallyltransferase